MALVASGGRWRHIPFGSPWKGDFFHFVIIPTEAHLKKSKAND